MHKLALWFTGSFLGFVAFLFAIFALFDRIDAWNTLTFSFELPGVLAKISLVLLLLGWLLPGKWKWRLVGVPVPKEVWAEYVCEPVSIDDKKYVVLFDGNKTLLWAIFLVLFAILAPQIVMWATSYHESILLTLISMLALCGAMWFLAGKSLNVKKAKSRIIYDRARGVVILPTWWFIFRSQEWVWKDVQGRFLFTYVRGIRYYQLFLQHLSTNKTFMVYSGDDPYVVAGYWSFIVDYMDGGKPLPNIPRLSNYPRRKRQRRKKRDREDNCWIIQNKYDDIRGKIRRYPELDRANHEIMQQRKRTFYSGIEWLSRFYQERPSS